MIAEVIELDIIHSDVDKIFDYIIPSCLMVEVGCRVIVPFGRRDVEGFVIGIKDNSDVPEGKLKAIKKILDEIPPLTPEIIDFSKYISNKYHATMTEVLRLMIPTEMRGGKVHEIFKTFVKPTEMSYENAMGQIRSNAKNQIALTEAVFGGESDYTLLATSYGYNTLKALEKKGIIEEYIEKVQRTPYEFMECKKEMFNLSDDQKKAVDTIENTDKLVTLIHGVTGCGKTEIYLKLFEKCLKNNETAIMLVPEIALTPQMVTKLRARFGDEVAIIHSGLSMGERFDEWWRLRLGEAKIVVGARSAIFSPLQNIGVIVIDEEHETSYFSEKSPRYSTHVLAKYLAKNNNAKLVLGSATPSIESYFLAKKGKYELVEISKRVNKKIMPNFDIIDLKREVRRGNNSVISSYLEKQIGEVLESKDQAILFINRRGYASYLQCMDCGYVCSCNDCDVTLTYHKYENALKCHYCGQRYKIPTRCPKCGGEHFKRGGFGTETVVKELEKKFPNARVLRMDRDNTKTKESHSKILQQFREKKADILVGTQMVAKGHDFPAVTLVGIINADMSLYFSDFRSAERTFQLITQVAGRAGRGDKKGSVVLQTYSPKHPIYDLAVHYDYKKFFESEVSLRQATHYPPFADILRIMIIGRDEKLVKQQARILYNNALEIKKAHEDTFSYLNGMKSPITRIESKFRYQIIARIIGEDREAVIEKVYNIIEKYKDRRVITYLEENPNNMY